MATNFPPIGNIYAPPWVCFSPQLRGYCDVEFDGCVPNVVFTSVLVLHGGVPQLGSQRPDQQLFVDTDSDFIVREIQIVPLAPLTTEVAVAPSDLRVRLRDGDGRLITSDFMYAVDLCGPIMPGLALRHGTVVFVDLVNLNVATDLTVQLVFKGVKRSLCDNVDSPLSSDYVPMYCRYSKPQPGQEFSDCEYPFQFTSTVVKDLLHVPLQFDNDADFLWRGLSGDWNVPENDVATVGNVALTFYDPSGVALIHNAPKAILTPWNSPNAGMFRECILSNGAKLTPQWPEIFIPKGGVIEVDISFGAASTVRFSLRGVKVYQECR